MTSATAITVKITRKPLIQGHDEKIANPELGLSLPILVAMVGLGISET
jgi:hypothetical protein